MIYTQLRYTALWNTYTPVGRALASNQKLLTRREDGINAESRHVSQRNMISS